MNYTELKKQGFEESWINNIKENWISIEHGKYIMGIYLINEIDEDPLSGLLLETTRFGTSEDLDKIHRFFEGLAYEMVDPSNNTVIGKGIIDYSPYKEMEAYTGQPWEIGNKTSINRSKEQIRNDLISDNRKIELFEDMIGYLCELFHNEAEFIETLKRIGFTENEIMAEGLMSDVGIIHDKDINSLIQNANERISSQKENVKDNLTHER